MWQLVVADMLYALKISSFFKVKHLFSIEKKIEKIGANTLSLSDDITVRRIFLTYKKYLLIFIIKIC